MAKQASAPTPPPYNTVVTVADFRASALVLNQYPNNPILADVKRCMQVQRPIHRHHLREMLRLMLGSPFAKGSSDPGFESMIKGAHGFCNIAEWFNFGTLSNDLMKERTPDAVDLMSHGLIRMPYEFCIYHHALDFRTSQADSAQGYMQDFYFIHDAELMPESERKPDFEIDGNFRMMEFRLETYHDIGVCLVARLSAVTDFLFNSAGAYRVGVLCNPLGLVDQGLSYEINSMCDPVAVMNIMLNTKHLRVERVEPAAKLNKARVKQGKPPLFPYTIVHSNDYIAAMHEGMRMEREGHHASPRPHLRRGHLRHYKNEKVVFIRDMIINATKGDWTERDRYKVWTS